jgi:transcriptional regulator with XRE-family HTH domain
MKPDEERYREETRRLLGLLLAVAKREGKSLRSLEKKLGVGPSFLTKVASGKVIAQVRHVLMLCDALDLSWSDFYAMACQEKFQQQEDDMEKKMLALLVRHGILSQEAASAAPPAGETTPAKA